MRSFDQNAFLALLLLLHADPTQSFFCRHVNVVPAVRATRGASDSLQPLDIDYNHARECAKSFGQCTVEDMESMKNALHAERIANFLTAKEDPTWPEAELKDRILEEDLSLQLSMLKDYINDEGARPISVPTRADVYSVSPEAKHTASPVVEQLAEEGLWTDMLKNSENVAIIATLMIIMLLPDAVHIGMK